MAATIELIKRRYYEALHNQKEAIIGCRSLHELGYHKGKTTALWELLCEIKNCDLTVGEPYPNWHNMTEAEKDEAIKKANY